MTDTTLYLVRHGETEYNRLRIMQGRKINSVLNATGEAQAQALATRMAEVPLDAIYASTLTRALQTARAVQVYHPDVPLHQLADLEEMSWGVLEGMGRSDELSAALGDMHRHWQDGAYGYAVEDGESIRDVQTRALRALNHIVEKHVGETVLIVSHGRLLRVLIASILSDYGLTRMEEVKHTNTAVNKLIYRDGRYEAVLLNDTSHVEEAELIMVE